MLNLNDDPLIFKEHEFQLTKEVQKWSDLFFADIFVYLINFPSTIVDIICGKNLK